MSVLRGLLFGSSFLATLPACTDPVAVLPGEVTASWKAASGHSITALASATAGPEGAIAYADVTFDSAGYETQAHIKLQRLDSAGALRGDAIELGAMASGALSGLTLASDGARYLGCWGDKDSDQISCATASAVQGGASPALSIAGHAPALAYNAGTWALAHGTTGHLAIVKLSSDGLTAGSPVLFEAGAEPYFGMIPLLAPTQLGFVLAGGHEVLVHQLDFAFAEVAAPVDLGVGSSRFAAIAASGTKVAIGAGMNGLFLLEGATLLDKQVYQGGGNTGTRLALAAEGTSFVMLSAANGPAGDGQIPGAFEVRSLAPGAVPEVASVLPDDHRNYAHAPCVLVRLEDAMFLAVTQATPGVEVLVARSPQL